MIDTEKLTPADRALWEAMGKAKPLHSPAPLPGAPNELAAIEKVARAVGKPLLPWQRWQFRVLTEKFADDPRRYRFPEFTVTVPRQSSKTTGTNILLLTRALLYSERKAFYTAQTGKDAAERFGDLAEMATRSPLARGLKWRKAIGSQRLTVAKTGSVIAPFAPTPNSLHGYSPNDVALDEIFSLDAVGGNDLMGAIKPAQQTKADRQLIMLSTAGHAGSVFLRERVDIGRVAVENPHSRIGYLEWAFPPDADAFDTKTWVHHPALGHLVTMQDLIELCESTPRGEWIRAFGNNWVENFEPLFDMARWGELAAELPKPKMSEVVLGFSQASDRTRAAVVAAWRTNDGKIAVKPVLITQDVSGFSTRVAEFDERRPLLLVADDGGLDRVLIDEVRRILPEHRSVTALTPKDWVLASTGLASAIEEGRIRHSGDEALTAAIGAAISKPMGEAWALSHKSRPEVLALAAAVRGLEAMPRQAPTPFIYTGD